MADDDKFFAHVVSKFLSNAGFEVSTAANGEEALGLVERVKPDLLILDVALPLISGDELARRLEAKRPPTLFISGRDLDRVAGMAGAPVRCLTKPADLDDILQAVKALLD